MSNAGLACRPGCGACCIAPSISSLDKPAGVPCPHLTADWRCSIFGQAWRPACCAGLQPSSEMCGDSREQALAWLAKLEKLTAPTAQSPCQAQGDMAKFTHQPVGRKII